MWYIYFFLLPCYSSVLLFSLCRFSFFTHFFFYDLLLLFSVFFLSQSFSYILGIFSLVHFLA